MPNDAEFHFRLTCIISAETGWEPRVTLMQGREVIALDADLPPGERKQPAYFETIYTAVTYVRKTYPNARLEMLFGSPSMRFPW